MSICVLWGETKSNVPHLFALPLLFILFFTDTCDIYTLLCVRFLVFVMALEEKIKLYLMAFPSGLYLEEIASNFDIISKTIIMSSGAALGLGWVSQDNETLKKAEKLNRNVIVIDTTKPAGKNIVVVVKTINYTRVEIKKRRREFKKHFSVYRNFDRSAHKHDPRSYYSEVGTWGLGTPLLSRVGANQGSFKNASNNFGKLAHTARGHFSKVISSISYDDNPDPHRRKRKRSHNSCEKRPSIPGAEAPNGMFTADFFIRMHLDEGDANVQGDRDRHSGYTACQSLPASYPKGSYFFIPEYGIKISLDEPCAWLFFGGEVVHGTTEPSFTDVDFKRHRTKVGPYLTAEQTRKLLIVWGAYARDSPRNIYRSNVDRLRRHISGQRVLTQYYARRVRAGIRNYENASRDMRARDRTNNHGNFN